VARRERNPERSRERILAAALEEFSAKGYAGARVEAIAQRAGLNKQLISHHFGGKEALYRAVMEERRAGPGGELATQPENWPETLARFFDAARRDPLWIRVLLWETLEVSTGEGPLSEQRQARYRERVAWIADEQTRGALPSGLDPALLYLSLIGATVYPLLLPHVAALVTGVDPTGDAFAERYAAHLTALVGALDPA
jgi:AcrR family transcriptional regulator